MPALPTLRPRTARLRAPARSSAHDRAHDAVIDCAVYVDGLRLPQTFHYREAIAEVRRRGEGFVWIGLYEPDARRIQGIASELGLHELAVEDAVQAHQRPKLDQYGETSFMVLKTVNYVEHSRAEGPAQFIETGELMAFVGSDFVVTVRHGKHSGLALVRQTLEANHERLALGPMAVLHAVADHVVDRYLAVTETVADDIDEMESRVFAPHTSVTSEQIYLMKRQVMELRRAVMPLAAPLRRLSNGSVAAMPEEVAQYFRDVDDHLSTVSERVLSFDELLTTLVDAALAKITVQQNSDMRKISSWLAIITFPMMVGGIYGMNFDYMPETHWRYSYFVVIGMLAVGCAVIYRGFRRNGWL